MIYVVSLAEVVVLILLLLVKSRSTKVYRFYRPTCPYCVNTQDEWNRFKRLCTYKLITPIDINMDNASEHEMRLADNFGVEGVPYIVKVLPNGYRTVHNGERSAEGLMAFSKYG